MVGGVSEGALGAVLAYVSAGSGAYWGLIIGVHGLDVANAGFNELLHGAPQDTLTSQGLQKIGLPQDAANIVDAGISMAGTMGSGAAIKAAQSTTITVGTSASGQEPTTTLFHGGVLRDGKISGRFCATPVREHALKYANDRVNGIVYEFKVPERVLNQLEVEGSVIRGLDSYKGVGESALQYEFSPWMSSMLNSYMIK